MTLYIIICLSHLWWFVAKSGGGNKKMKKEQSGKVGVLCCPDCPSWELLRGRLRTVVESSPLACSLLNRRVALWDPFNPGAFQLRSDVGCFISPWGREFQPGKPEENHQPRVNKNTANSGVTWFPAEALCRNEVLPTFPSRNSYFRGSSPRNVRRWSRKFRLRSTTGPSRYCSDVGKLQTALRWHLWQLRRPLFAFFKKHFQSLMKSILIHV